MNCHYAAEQGEKEAQFQLGKKYAIGEMVSKDYQQAGKWVSKSAEQGDSDAQYSLGCMYYEGKGVAQDNKHTL